MYENVHLNLPLVLLFAGTELKWNAGKVYKRLLCHMNTLCLGSHFFFLLASENVFRTFGYLSFEMVNTCIFSLCSMGLSYGWSRTQKRDVMNKEIDFVPVTKERVLGMRFIILGKIRRKKKPCLYNFMSAKKSAGSTSKTPFREIRE